MTVLEKARCVLNNIAGALAIAGLLGLIFEMGVWWFLFSLIIPFYISFIAEAVLYFLNGNPKFDKYRKGFLIPIIILNILFFCLCYPNIFHDLTRSGEFSLNTLLLLYACVAVLELIFEILVVVQNKAKASIEVREKEPITLEILIVRIMNIVTIFSIIGFGVWAIKQEDEFEGFMFCLFLLLIVIITIIIFGFSRKIHYGGYITFLLTFFAIFVAFFIFQYKSIYYFMWEDIKYYKHVIALSCVGSVMLAHIITVIACGIIEYKKKKTQITSIVKPIC